MGVTDGDREYKYFRGATQTGIAAGVLQLGDDQAGGRTLRGGHVEATIRLSSAITSPPAAAITAQLWAQEV
jgi:3,4-dihydroxy-2-butanone 4-phosphate synthase